MSKIAYITRRFDKSSVEVIQQAEAICSEYARKGYSLTVRQIYYQFVSRGLMPNRQSEYKRLVSILSDARLAGSLDWNYIVDRTRSLKGLSHWDTPDDIIRSASASYRLNRWEGQDNYVEVWIEKDALTGVIEKPCQDLDIPFLSCRGYTSQSEVWTAGQRLARQLNNGKSVHVIHLGDHDPSGMDMTRDIESRLLMFTEKHATGGTFTVNRIALNMDQIEQYSPPPNPAKLTDSRALPYIERYGVDSWELDALNPEVIGALIKDEVEPLIDWDSWNIVEQAEEEGRAQLDRVSDNWDAVVNITDVYGTDRLEDLHRNWQRIDSFLTATEGTEEGTVVNSSDVSRVLYERLEKLPGYEVLDRWKVQSWAEQVIRDIDREAL